VCVKGNAYFTELRSLCSFCLGFCAMSTPPFFS